MITLASPLGLLALLGIPIVLLIHRLHRRPQHALCTTLFLLQQLERRSDQGNRLEKLRQSLPLWLQIALIVLFSLILSRPQVKEERTVHRVVIVLDSSVSMRAFSTEAEKAVAEITARTPTPMELTVLESHPDAYQIYYGGDADAALAALEDWQPSHSQHSTSETILLARSLMRGGGQVHFISDHARETVPSGVAFQSVGEAFDNVGFSGRKVSTNTNGMVTASVLLKNYSATAQERTVSATTEAGQISSRSYQLAGGETRSIDLAFPEGIDWIQFESSGDRFAIDDRTVITREIPVPLKSAVSGANAPSWMIDFRSRLPGLTVTDQGEDVDVMFQSYNPLQPSAIEAGGVIFLNQGSVPAKFYRDPVVPAEHELMKGLSWEGLIARRTASIPVAAEDEVLLWQGDRPMIWLRQSDEGEQSESLVFNFDVQHSNALRLPAFVVLVHRYLNEIRSESLGFRSENTELGQTLSLPIANDQKWTLWLDGTQQAHTGGNLVKMPNEPGMVEVKLGEEIILRAANAFADTREANFTSAAPAETAGDTKSESTDDGDRLPWLASLLFLIGLGLFFWLWPTQTTARTSITS